MFAKNHYNSNKFDIYIENIYYVIKMFKSKKMCYKMSKSRENMSEKQIKDFGSKGVLFGKIDVCEIL